MELLVTGAFALSPEEQAHLTAVGYNITFHADERVLPDMPARYDAVICNGLFVYHPLSLFSALRVIQLTSAGTDRVPIEEIQARGIQLYNAGAAYSIPMAEWTLAAILNFYKKFPFFYCNQQRGVWEKNRAIPELCGRTALILGYGNAGREIAKRLKAFDCRVIAVDRRTDDAGFADVLLPPERAQAQFPDADILILTLPLTRETAHYLDRARLALLPAHALLVNPARGGLIDEAALLDALRNDKIGGAALDVFEREPLERDNPLWQCDRVLITPHNSFVGEGNHQRLFAVIEKNLRSFVSFKEC